MGAATNGFPHEVSALELHWLAGLLEGEGSFLTGPPSSPRHPILALQMTDADVVERVTAMFGRKAGSWQPRDAKWQTAYIVRVTGAKAVIWMAALRPLLGRRRQTQIDRAMASYDPKPAGLLNDESAREALRLLASGESVREVAERFGASVWCIYDLRGGRTHKHLTRP